MLAPTPANAGEDEFARQKGAKMHENVLSKKRTGWTPSPPGTIAYDRDHGKYRALRKAQKEREKAKKEAEEKTVKEELVSELTTKFLKNYTKAAKSKWDEMSDDERKSRKGHNMVRGVTPPIGTSPRVVTSERTVLMRPLMNSRVGMSVRQQPDYFVMPILLELLWVRTRMRKSCISVEQATAPLASREHHV